jgi:hypothetical protein
MTRDQAKAWFEENNLLRAVDPQRSEAYALAIEALTHEKFTVLREGEIAVIEVERHLPPEAHERFRERWLKLTSTKAVILDGGVRLAGKIEKAGPSYDVPAEPL